MEPNTSSGENGKEQTWSNIRGAITSAYNSLKSTQKIIRTVRRLKDAAKHGKESMGAVSSQTDDVLHHTANHVDDAAHVANDGVGSATNTANGAFRHAADHADDAGHVINDGIGGATSYADAASDVATEAASEGGRHLLGWIPIVAAVVGYALDDAEYRKQEKRSHHAMAELCPADIKLAVQYYERNTVAGKPTTLKRMSLTERHAFTNLYDVMARHGGSRMLGRKILRDIGTVTGIFGKAGGGLGVYAFIKSMENDEGVPTREQIGDRQIWGNILGGYGTLFLGVLFPPSLFFTLSTMGAMNIAAQAFKSNVTQWHDRLTSENGMQEFFYKIGSQARSTLRAQPDRWTDEAVLQRIQQQAENAAGSISTRDGHHSREDVHILDRFAKGVEWFGYAADIFDGAGGGAQQELKERSAALKKFIKDAKIVEKKETLINVSKQSKKEKS